MEELADKVNPDEQPVLELALEKLHAMEVKYDDGLLVEDPGYIIEFCNDLFELNAFRWAAHNGMNEEKYEEVLKSLQGISEEMLQ